MRPNESLQSSACIPPQGLIAGVKLANVIFDARPEIADEIP